MPSKTVSVNPKCNLILLTQLMFSREFSLYKKSHVICSQENPNNKGTYRRLNVTMVFTIVLKSWL